MFRLILDLDNHDIFLQAVQSLVSIPEFEFSLVLQRIYDPLHFDSNSNEMQCFSYVLSIITDLIAEADDIQPDLLDLFVTGLTKVFSFLYILFSLFSLGSNSTSTRTFNSRNFSNFSIYTCISFC